MPLQRYRWSSDSLLEVKMCCILLPWLCHINVGVWGLCPLKVSRTKLPVTSSNAFSQGREDGNRHGIENDLSKTNVMKLAKVLGISKRFWFRGYFVPHVPREESGGSCPSSPPSQGAPV